MQFYRSMVALAFTAALVLPTSAFAAGDEAKAESDKMPSTAEEHLDMAKKYDAKAAEYKAEAAMHKKMMADYERQNSAPNLKSKLGKDPWIDKMKAHCETYITNAEALAKEATAFADYHRMRGKEMQGK